MATTTTEPERRYWKGWLPPRGARYRLVDRLGAVSYHRTLSRAAATLGALQGGPQIERADGTQLSRDEVLALPARVRWAAKVED
jgi:hypothetical protein